MPDLTADIYFLRADEAGRRSFVASGYRPSHNFQHHRGVNDAMHSYPGRKRVEPGETVRTELSLAVPCRNHGRLYVGMPFTAQEGNQIVGRGTIVEILNRKLERPPLPESLAGSMMDHCLVAKCPYEALLNTGAFPDGWVSRFLGMLEWAMEVYRNKLAWPRDVAAAVYAASQYCPTHYRDWQSATGSSNGDTEIELSEIRGRSNELMFGWYFEPPAGNEAFSRFR